MRLRQVVPWSLVAVLAVVLAGAWGCSSSNNGYSNPVAPGGGGGGGAKELDSGNIGPGAAFEHRFFTAGNFNYHCAFHSPMTGTAVVSSSAADTVVNVSITSSTSPFPGASVKPGGRVIWTNNTGMTHTVTSN